MARLKYSDNQLGRSFDRSTYPPLEGAGGGNTTAFYTGFSWTCWIHDVILGSCHGHPLTPASGGNDQGMKSP
jgi:hypothetical protein